MKGAPVLLLALAACAAPQPAGRALPAGGEATCRSEGLDRFVGQRADAALGARMLEASRARVLRWVAPGMAVTMDFRADRLTVGYDADYIVTRASCG